MQLGQAVRRFNDQVRAGWSALTHSLARTPSPAARGRGMGALARRALLLLVALIALYYGIGALLMQRIDTNPDFTIDPAEVLEGESESVAYAASVLAREVNRYGWVSNDPFYLPTSLLWNMGAYQTGILSTVLHFTESLGQALTARGMASSDLDAAAVRLSRPGDVWEWDLSNPLGFLGRSENQYREGILALNGFNVAVADGSAPLPRDAALLTAVLDGFGQSLDAAAHRLTEEAKSKLVFFDTDISDAFYEAKGTAYTEFVIFRGLKTDFGAVIRAHDAEGEFDNVAAALKDAALLSPLFIANGAPDGAIFPSHPYVASYFLLRAKDALDDLVAKLGKDKD